MVSLLQSSEHLFFMRFSSLESSRTSSPSPISRSPPSTKKLAVDKLLALRDSYVRFFLFNGRQCVLKVWRRYGGGEMASNIRSGIIHAVAGEIKSENLKYHQF